MKQMIDRVWSSKSAVLIAWLVLLLFLFGLYRFSAAPSIGWVDSGVISAAVAQLGIANPPGFPTYMILAYPWTLLQFVPLVVRLQLFSNILALTNLVLVGLLTRRAIPSSRYKEIIALLTSLLIGTSYTFWLQANHAETTHLTLFFVLFILFLTSTLSFFLNKYTPKALPLFVLIGMAIGLGVGTNPIIVSILPAGLWWLWHHRRTLHYYRKELLLTTFLSLIIGIGVYLYLPVRAATHPFTNWGDPQTVERFFIHLRGAGLNIYEPETGSINGFTGQPIVFLQSFVHFLHMLSWQWTPLLLPFIAIGALQLRRRHKELFSLLGFTILGNLTCVVLYFGGNQESWMLISWVCLAVFLGTGLTFLATQIASRFPSPKGILAGSLGLLTLIPLFFWFPTLNHRDHTFPNVFAIDLYRDVPDNAVIIGGGDFFHSVTSYERLSQGKTITPITYNMFFIFPWYRENLRRNTDLVISQTTEARTQPVSIEGVTRTLEQLVKDNPDKTFFVTPLVLRESIIAGTKDGVYKPSEFSLQPHGLIFQIVPKDTPLTIDEDLYQFTALPLLTKEPPFYLERNFSNAVQNYRAEYATAFEGIARFFASQNNLEKADTYYQRMEQVGPTMNGNYTQLLAIYYAQQQRWEEAQQWFIEAQRKSPENPLIAQNISIFQQERAKAATASGTPTNQTRTSLSGVTFMLPDRWSIERDMVSILLLQKETLKVEIRRTQTSLTLEDYIATQTTSLGTKRNEGMAQIPGSNASFVRIWDDGDDAIWQFFIFKGTHVFDVRVSTDDDARVREVDPILTSLQSP